MTIKRESIIKASNTLALNWATTDINAERSLGPVNWEALQEYAINVKRKHAGNHDVQTTCQQLVAQRIDQPSALFVCNDNF
jgi:hypothetical protein